MTTKIPANKAVNSGVFVARYAHNKSAGIGWR